MVYSLKSFYEYLLGDGNVVECYGAVFKEPFGHLLVYQLVYKRADAFRCILRQGARGGFYGVCHHQYSLFACERIGTGVCKQGFVYRFVRMFVLI